MKYQTIVEHINHWAAETPDKVCLIEAETGRTCTYAQLWRWGVAFSKRLSEIGINKGDRVVVRVGGLPETYTALFGIHLAGGVYCPVEQYLKAPKLIEMMECYDAKILISELDPGGEYTVIALKSVIGGSTPDIPDEHLTFPEPDDLSIIIFTTGTTGKSKGVMHSHRTHILNMIGWLKNFGLSSTDVFLTVQPLDRAGGAVHNFSALLAGGTVVFHKGVVFSLNVFKAIEKYGVTAAYFQPPAVSILLNAMPDAFAVFAEQIRVLVFGGAIVPENLKKEMVRLLPKSDLYVMYAASEINQISYYNFSQIQGRANCVGIPLPNSAIYLVDENGKEMFDSSIDNLGVVSIESQATFIGYWKSPELTKSIIRDGRILMTDLGYKDEEGYLYLMSRRDDVIVTGGFKVAPYEIEEAVMNHGGISECACIAVPDKVMGQIPKLFVCMKRGYTFSAKDIANFLSQTIETYKVPREIREVESFPRMGETSKINRRELLSYE